MNLGTKLTRIGNQMTHRSLASNPTSIKSMSTVTSISGTSLQLGRSIGNGMPRDSASGNFLMVGAAALLATFGILDQTPNVTWNHCQVPCGIFDDPAIVNELKQASTTIRKAMVQSSTLHETVSTDALAFNQMVRWIQTKEEHCNKIIHLVSDYCLCQRVKKASFPSELEYLRALKMHHVVMQAAMKAKQSMDPSVVDDLDHTLADLAKMYTK